MSVKIRMSRHGTKKKPFFRIVVADSEKPRDGAFIEIVGTFDPKLKDKSQAVVLKKERLQHWLSKGAQPSPTVKQMIKKYLAA